MLETFPKRLIAFQGHYSVSEVNFFKLVVDFGGKYVSYFVRHSLSYDFEGLVEVWKLPRPLGTSLFD